MKAEVFVIDIKERLEWSFGGNIWPWGSANFFCKGSGCKYLRLLGSYGLCCNYSPLLGVCICRQRQHVNKWAWLLSQLACVAITKYHGLGDFSNRNWIEAGSPRSRCWLIQSVVRAVFLACWWLPFSLCPLIWHGWGADGERKKEWSISLKP